MSKKQVRKYIFSPGLPNVGQVTIPGFYPAERILLITNLTSGTILFNFADQTNTGGTISFKPGSMDQQNASYVSYGLDVNSNPPSNYATVQYMPTVATPTQTVGTVRTIGETVIIFKNVDTSGMNATDHLSVLVEDQYQIVRTWGDFGTDAVERQRVAAPQSLIDADFEYGLQLTKWADLQLVNNYPSIYELVQLDLAVTLVTADNSSGVLPTKVVVYAPGHGLSAGNAFTISTLLKTVPNFSGAEGGFLVISANATAFTYYSKSLNVFGYTGTITNVSTTGTQVRAGGLYIGSALPTLWANTNGANPSTITVTFGSPHGFVPGMPILVNANPSLYNTTSNTALANLSGAYYIDQLLGPNSAIFTARGVVGVSGGTFNVNPTVNGGATDIGSTISVYTRPDGTFTHRPGDGGVIISTGSAIHGAKSIRQTKKYFRYQSGKGYMYTTGVLFAPSFDIQSMTSSGNNVGSTITCRTQIPHGIQAGATVKIAGVNTSGYDGTFVVNGVIDEYTVTFLATQQLNLQTGGFIGYYSPAVVNNVPKLYLYNWYGSAIRTGPHDDANGMFVEYDGQTFNCVKRTSTQQIAGSFTFIPGSTEIQGDSNALLNQQLYIGSKIVIKGMIYRVSQIWSSTLMSVTPAYRGAKASSANYIWVISEERYQQLSFNTDTVDGSGSVNNPSGYLMDPSRVQMIGIQFTWYGAGFMDFMVRGHDGNYIIIHRMKQNNVNTTASMRSANLPARYEIDNASGHGITYMPLTSAGIPASGATVIPVADASGFPPNGYVMVDSELFQYSSKTTTPSNGAYYLTIANRGTNNALTSANIQAYVGGQIRRFDGNITPVYHAPGAGVELVSLTASPTISHWGSAYIADGGFDFDRGYLFSYSTFNANVTGAGVSVMGLRLSPSASNSLTGDLGDRELINRAQLLLQNITITCSNTNAYSNVAILCQGVLNANNYSTSQTWTPLSNQNTGNQPSLSQITSTPIFNGWSSTIPGFGEKIFEFTFVPNQPVTRDLTHVKELNTSAIGGKGCFPDGPDTLYVVLTTIGLSAQSTTNFISNVHCSLIWHEAQA